MCILLLLYNIYLFDKYIYYRNKVNIYIQMMAHLHGGATMWIEVYTTPLSVLGTSDILRYCVYRRGRMHLWASWTIYYHILVYFLSNKALHCIVPHSVRTRVLLINPLMI